MKINYQSLEKKIKVNFKDKNLLIKSLTHKSFDNKNNNGRDNKYKNLSLYFDRSNFKVG